MQPYQKPRIRPSRYIDLIEDEITVALEDAEMSRIEFLTDLRIRLEARKTAFARI